MTPKEQRRLLISRGNFYRALSGRLQQEKEDYIVASSFHFVAEGGDLP